MRLLDDGICNGSAHAGNVQHENVLQAARRLKQGEESERQGEKEGKTLEKAKGQRKRKRKEKRAGEAEAEAFQEAEKQGWRGRDAAVAAPLTAVHAQQRQNQPAGTAAPGVAASGSIWAKRARRGGGP